MEPTVGVPPNPGWPVPEKKPCSVDCLFPSNSVSKHYYNGIDVQSDSHRGHDQTIFWK